MRIDELLAPRMQQHRACGRDERLRGKRRRKPVLRAPKFGRSPMRLANQEIGGYEDKLYHAHQRGPWVVLDSQYPAAARSPGSRSPPYLVQ